MFLKVLFICYLGTVVESIQTNILMSIMENLGIYNPHIVKLNSVKNDIHNIRMMKVTSKYGQKVSFNLQNYNEYECIVVFTNTLNSFKWKFHTKKVALVITEIHKDTDWNNLDIRIDEEVYFLDRNSLKLYETYSINNVQITTYLGTMHK